MVKATFATIFALICKYDSKCGLYIVCYSFALKERYVCNTFALCKFNVNLFFRPVKSARFIYTIAIPWPRRVLKRIRELTKAMFLSSLPVSARDSKTSLA